MTIMTALKGWWWISALLVMAVRGGVPVDSLTDTENKAVRLVREDFHKTYKEKNAFQVSSMLTPVEQELSNGTFVKVKFTMKQTKCKRQKWMNPDCAPIMKVKRTYNCVGCFKFASSGDLLKTGYKKCVRQSLANTKEVRKERRKECAKLRDKKPKKPTNNVGAFSFRRASLGQYD